MAKIQFLMAIKNGGLCRPNMATSLTKSMELCFFHYKPSTCIPNNPRKHQTFFRQVGLNFTLCILRGSNFTCYDQSIINQLSLCLWIAHTSCTKIPGELHRVDADLLGWWLAERQLPSGGLNGRPEKLPDVCYSWWVLSSLSIIGRLSWIDSKALKKFILARYHCFTIKI